MHLLTRIENRTGFQKQSARTWEGPCPKCGGTKRCIVWINEDIFKCRDCNFKGDIIKWLREVEGMTCKQAFLAINKECSNHQCPHTDKCKGTTPKRQNDRATINLQQKQKIEKQPTEYRTPEQAWQHRAEKLVTESHIRLLEMYQDQEPQLKTPASYLAERGLDYIAVVKYRLGWLIGDNNKNCLFRPRETWGLPEQIDQKTKKPKKLWIPRGIVIPTIIGNTIDRIRIRRPQADLTQTNGKQSPKYIAIEGGGTQTITLNPAAQAQIAIESDLDALLIDHLAGDIIGSIPLTTCSIMPNGQAAQACKNASIILIALDFDTPKLNPSTGIMERAGQKAWRTKWQPTYPQAERWPVPTGKDPGEAYQAGIDLRSWIISGLPLSLQPKTTHIEPVKQIEPAKEQAHQEVWLIKAKDGREIHITDNEDKYRKLITDGKITFNSRELALIKKTGTSQDQIRIFLDVKQIFPHASIQKVTEIIPEVGAVRM